MINEFFEVYQVNNTLEQITPAYKNTLYSFEIDKLEIENLKRDFEVINLCLDILYGGQIQLLDIFEDIKTLGENRNYLMIMAKND